MNKLNTFTSTGNKLIHHPYVVNNIKQHKIALPISLQIAPTSACNLNCEFCSNSNRDKHEQLEPIYLTEKLNELINLGTVKTLEWTGGGDPTMYPYLRDMILYFSKEVQQGLITNGVLLKEKVPQKAIDKLHWVRISMNCLDYVEKIELPEIKGTLGFSYVMNNKTDGGVLGRLNEHVIKYEPSYVRIVPNCQATNEEHIINNKKLSVLVEQWGEPYFYQTKTFATPKSCYWCYLKPFILHDGWVYPCSSVILNDTADCQFHKDFRWSSLDALIEKYSKPMESFNSVNCNHCVFKEQNDMVEDLINPNNMVNFI